MNNALIEIVVYAVKEKYVSEKAFYTNQLNISAQSWDRWKKGDQGLKYDNMKIISNLFTDYEWMLVQKVARNAEIMSDLMAHPVREFTFLKYQIARQWLDSGVARLEWHQTSENEKGSARTSNNVVLRIIQDYNFWGYSDIIELRLPGIIQQQIGHDELKLLQWMDSETEKLKEDK